MLTETGAGEQQHPIPQAPFPGNGTTISRRARHPLLTFFLASLSGFLGMMYVGQGRKAIVYLLLESGCFLIAKTINLYLIWPSGPIAAAGLFVVKTAGILQCMQCGHRLRGGARMPWYSHWYSGPLLSILALATTAVCFVHVIDLKKITGNSMNPTLLDREYVLSFSWPYKQVQYGGHTLVHKPVAQINRGDLMVMRYPDEPEELVVKRIIGVPGDRIIINRNQLIINQRPVERRIIEEQNDIIIYQEVLDGQSYQVIYANVEFPHATQEFAVPENSYFVLGDNRDISYDSRYWIESFVPLQYLTGKVLRVAWSETTPPEPVRWKRIGLPVR